MFGSKCFEKISLSDELFLHFENSESDRFAIYLHGSNSIFGPGGIKSEWCSGGTVSELGMSEFLVGT